MSELPADVWETIFERVAQTDLLRSADLAARDIAAAACTCRTANAAAGAGWRALLPADPKYREQRKVESDEDIRQWHDAAQRFHQVH